MSDDVTPESSQPAAIRVKTSADAQVTAMVSDPRGYFTRAREEARREAQRYIAARGHIRPA